MQEGDEITTEKCTKCSSVMLFKTGKFGKYYKCTKCGATKSLTEQKGVCPICHKSAQKMVSKKKGVVYYGCSGYPTCNFISWDIPTGDLCPTCGQYLIEKDGKVLCSDKKCNYEKQA
jgi:DNA topoisomerase-1